MKETQEYISVARKLDGKVENRPAKLADEPLVIEAASVAEYLLLTARLSQAKSDKGIPQILRSVYEKVLLKLNNVRLTPDDNTIINEALHTDVLKGVQVHLPDGMRMDRVPARDKQDEPVSFEENLRAGGAVPLGRFVPSHSGINKDVPKEVHVLADRINSYATFKDVNLTGKILDALFRRDGSFKLQSCETLDDINPGDELAIHWNLGQSDSYFSPRNYTDDTRRTDLAIAGTRNTDRNLALNPVMAPEFLSIHDLARGGVENVLRSQWDDRDIHRELKQLYLRRNADKFSIGGYMDEPTLSTVRVPWGASGRHNTPYGGSRDSYDRWDNVRVGTHEEWRSPNNPIYAVWVARAKGAN